LEHRYQIITFYEFKDLAAVAPLAEIRDSLRAVMKAGTIKGTIILGEEGFNSTVAGEPDAISSFVPAVERILDTKLRFKSSFNEVMPFRRVDVKVKPEIVTLKQPVDISLGSGTHVEPKDWNAVISDPDVFLLDTRNDYEFQNGTFRCAINPKTEKFSDLPAFVAENLDPEKHKKVAVFCTGGIRCEKFAPYLVRLGFENVYQLEGGILKYLEEMPAEESLWEGECFVFDDRITVDQTLSKGIGRDYSQGEKD
jgi:UPF0176 protein